jgi:hypothetical protein
MLSNNNSDIEILLNKYFLLINNYTIFFLDTIKNMHTHIYINIYIKGIKIIETVFLLSLYYYRSINDIYSNTEKSYVYFIEFINQINFNNNLDVNNETNFDITIKDAIIFAYKKTIFVQESKINENTNIFSNKNLIYLKNRINLINNIYILNYDFNIINYNYNNSEIKKNFKNNICNIKKIIEKITNKFQNEKIKYITDIIKLLYNSNIYEVINKKYNNLFEVIEKFITYTNNGSIYIIDIKEII